ncbi:cation:proton antiporter [Candidatus Woesearchaeota archaeon]|nr:cation:proton antiporter [Candidatus Woesearchaeota archaeon]
MIENVLLVLLVVLVVAKLMGGLFQKIGLDSSIGELLTGVILGSYLLNLVDAEKIEPFALLGSILILFIAGLKQSDIQEMLEEKKAFHIGITLLFVTSILMSLLFYYVLRYFGIEFSIVQAIVLGIAFAIIDIGVPAKVFISNGLINLPIGKLIIRSAIINIILGLFLFTIVTIFFKPSFFDILTKIVGILLFVGIIIGLIYFLTKISQFVMKLHIEEAELSLSLILVLALAYLSDKIGFSSVLGAFIAGVLIAKMPFSETTTFSQKIKSISFGLFIPLFFVWFGLEIDVNYIIQNILLIFLIFVSYTAIRFFLMYLFMKKYKIKTIGVVSSSMLSIDVESLVILLVAKQLGIFTDEIPLSLFAPSVLLSTLVIVILVAVFSKKELKNKKRLISINES